MSFTFHGIPGSENIGIGRAHVVSRVLLKVDRYDIESSNLQFECDRLMSAIKKTQNDLSNLVGKLPANTPREFEAFLNLHKMILKDPTLSKETKKLIKELHCNAEWALKLQTERLWSRFDAVDDKYLRDKKNDITQAIERVLSTLLGRPDPVGKSAVKEKILVAHDLSPTDIISLRNNNLEGFITDLGGKTSHSSIIASSLNIPFVVALHNASEVIKDDDQLIVDGFNGVVIVNPVEEILKEYEILRKNLIKKQDNLQYLRFCNSATLDLHAVELLANIELPEDTALAKQNGAGGVGLLRSEFMFLGRRDRPSEDEQFEKYVQAIKNMDGLPVTIRTLDIGSDKQDPNAVNAISNNPALGLRAIRHSLMETDMFLDQLRAIFRASIFGPTKILLPMLTTQLELSQIFGLIKQAKENLRDRKIEYDPSINIGGMIETPAAALKPEIFLESLDFISIGTNDLIQYVMAIDRHDDNVAHLYDALNPAIIELMANLIQKAGIAKKPATICGEMASDPKLTKFLLGIGLRSFSMHPSHLLQVKQVIVNTDLSKVQNLVNEILKCWDRNKIGDLMIELNQ